jgi:hypothetical protein
MAPIFSPKILVIVGHALYEPWKSILIDGQLETWAKDPSEDVKHSYANVVRKSIKNFDSKLWNLKWDQRFGAFLVILEVIFKWPMRLRQGNLRESKVAGTNYPSIVIDIPDLDLLMNFKSFGVITGTLKFDYDYLVTVTTSSYLNLMLLRKEITLLPSKNVIAGRIIEQNKIKFASGCFRVFSRDVVEEILSQKKLYSKWRAEDLAYGYLVKLAKLNAQFIDLKSIDLDTAQKVNELSEQEIQTIVHFRLKSGPNSNRADVEIMRSLHERILKSC